MWLNATAPSPDRKSTRLNSSHTVIYTLSLHDALPISEWRLPWARLAMGRQLRRRFFMLLIQDVVKRYGTLTRSEEHTSELQSHSDLHSFPTRRSSDLGVALALGASSNGTSTSTEIFYAAHSRCG